MYLKGLIAYLLIFLHDFNDWKLGIEDWIARKEFDRNDNPYMHLYVEISEESQMSGHSRCF